MKAGKVSHNMDVWWMVGDIMSGSTEDMGDGMGGEPAAVSPRVSPMGLDWICWAWGTAESIQHGQTV